MPNESGPLSAGSPSHPSISGIYLLDCPLCLLKRANLLLEPGSNAKGGRKCAAVFSPNAPLRPCSLD